MKNKASTVCINCINSTLTLLTNFKLDPPPILHVSLFKAFSPFWKMALYFLELYNSTGQQTFCPLENKRKGSELLRKMREKKTNKKHQQLFTVRMHSIYLLGFNYIMQDTEKVWNTKNIFF